MVTNEQVEEGVLRQRETGLRIGETLVASQAITEEDVGWALSRQLGLTLVDIDPAMLDTALVRSFRETLLRRSDAVPLLRTAEGVTFAVADPTDDESLDRLEEAAGGPIELSIGTPTAIRRALDAIFQTTGHSAVPDAATAKRITAESVRYDVVWERSGATFLAFHLTRAAQRGATELHFLPIGGQLHISYRENGLLAPFATEPLQVLDSLIARLEALGGPVLANEAHVRGHAVCPLVTEDVTLEISLLRGTEGVSVVLSPMTMPDATGDLESAGVDALEAAELRAALAPRAGLILVGGSPGADGARVLAALLAATDLAGARTLAFRREAQPSLPGTTAIALSADAARARWQQVVLAQRADVVVLEGILDGPALEQVLSPVGSRRLLIVASDWIDSFAALAHLAATPLGPAVLPRRLLAAIQYRTAVPGPPIVETLLAGAELRAAIAAGGRRENLLAAARTSGFRSLADRAAERVATGACSAVDATRALA